MFAVFTQNQTAEGPRYISTVISTTRSAKKYLSETSESRLKGSPGGAFEELQLVAELFEMIVLCHYVLCHTGLSLHVGRAQACRRLLEEVLA